MNADQQRPIPGPQATGGLVLMILLAALLLRAFWRLGLGWEIAHEAAADSQVGGGSAPLFWQMLDPLVGWLALLILALSNRLTHPRAKSANGLEGVCLLAGLAAWWTSAAVPDGPWRGPIEIAAAVPMVLVAILLVLRELQSVAATAPRSPAGDTPARGLNIEQLWRLVAAQWILVWVAANAYLLYKLHVPGTTSAGILSNPAARRLLFLLPAVGVLPNVLMAVGIRWWGNLVGRPRELVPRQRAWLLALGLQNLGAALVFAPARWLGVVGAVLMVASIALYLAGFPIVRGTGTSFLLLAWAWAATALATLGVERIMETAGQPVPAHLTAAWRIALTDGLPLTWLLAMGIITLRSRLSVPLQMPLMTRTIAALVTLACLVLVVTWLWAIQDRSCVQWLLAGAAVQWVAVLAGTMACLRAAQLLKNPPPP